MRELVIDNAILKYEVAHNKTFFQQKKSEESCSHEIFLLKQYLLIYILPPYHIWQFIIFSFWENGSIIGYNISIEDLLQVLHPSSQ